MSWADVSRKVGRNENGLTCPDISYKVISLDISEQDDDGYMVNIFHLNKQYVY